MSTLTNSFRCLLRNFRNCRNHCHVSIQTGARQLR
uniref:INTERLEUKIN-10 n=1 Tax=Siphoviridae sp. ctLqe90 TaxID=2825456 RepID=A0A8S5Q355_9CAUD|nr:MAG TPA: INTERLEUKIN-10 [Siphoviridae sp. ctLqe90]